MHLMHHCPNYSVCVRDINYATTYIVHAVVLNLFISSQMTVLVRCVY